MTYDLIKDTIDLVKEFESSNKNFNYSNDIEGLKNWIKNQSTNSTSTVLHTRWEGQENGRTAESVISTLLVHMNRYAKMYSKAAIHGSSFSSQDDFIFLIVLRAFGAMTKMELIKKNVQEKPVGIKIINRLILNGWINQIDSKKDKRSKLISITQKGIEALDLQMYKIRQATNIVSGPLNETEKKQLIVLLSKLEDFHQEIYNLNINGDELLEIAKER